jgi:hypothetical protein
MRLRIAILAFSVFLLCDTSLLDLVLFHLSLRFNPTMVNTWGKYAPMMLLINKAIGTISQNHLSRVLITLFEVM